MLSLQSSSLANPIGRSSSFDFGTKEVASFLTFSVGDSAPTSDAYITKPSDGSNVTISITHGILTFSFPQSNEYIGVGDKIEWIGMTNPVYLNKKLSSTKWEVHSLNQSNPTVNNSVLTKIDKSFSGIIAAVTSLSAISAITDLVSISSILRISLYKKSTPEVLSSPIIITNWVTDQDHYVRIFVPSDIEKECNSNQRHQGIYNGDDFYSLSTNSGIILGSGSSYTEIEGLKLFGQDEADLSLISYASEDVKGTKVLNNILQGAKYGISSTEIPSDNQIVVGNFIYDVLDGISMDSRKLIAYNNTITNFTGVGINLTAVGGNPRIRNCLIQIGGIGTSCVYIEPDLITTTTTTTWAPEYDDYQIDYCIIDDTSSVDGPNNYSSKTILFKYNVDFEDYRLDLRADDEAVRLGINLSNDNYYPFDKDGIGNDIDNTWPIGAHHFVRELRVAVGDPNSTDLKTETTPPLTATVENGLLTFSEAQTDYRLCSGCFVVINTITDPVILYEKISSTEWLVSQTGANNGKGNFDIATNNVTSITVKYNNLYEALVYDGISGVGLVVLNNGSSDFTDVSSDLKPTLYCSYGELIDGGVVSLTLDKTRQLTIKTPYIENECNSNRRHEGVWDSSKSFVTGGGGLDCIELASSYVTIDGLQINDSVGSGIFISDGHDYIVTNNIIKDFGTNGVYCGSVASGDSSVIAKNLIYDFLQNGIEIEDQLFLNHNSRTLVYNNTIIGGIYGIKIGMSLAHKYTNEVVLKNNLVQGSTIKSYEVSCLIPELTTFEACWSHDEYPIKFEGRFNRGFVNVNFSDIFKKDYRICLCSALEMRDASSSPSDQFYQYDTDFKNTTINMQSIGCDTYSVLENKIANFSTGSYTDSPVGITCEIVNSIITFSADPLSSNIGVGDIVSFVTGDDVYLAEKGNSTTWAVRNIDGTVVADSNGIQLVSFSRAFASVQSANEGVLIEIPDLTINSGTKVNIWCYADYIDETNLLIVDYVCDAINKIQIATPYNTKTQCNYSQRHSGVWTTGAFILKPNSNVAVEVGANIHADIIGIQIDGEIDKSGILFVNTSGAAVAINNIIKNCDIGINSIGDGGIVPVSRRAINNIIYECNTGISMEDGDAYHNTIVNTVTHGILSDGDVNFVSTNNICQTSTGDCFSNFGVSCIKNCISSDATADLFPDATLTFVDSLNKDYHLNRGDWQAINQGLVSILSDIYFPNYDIDMNLIDNVVSIGCDFYTGLVTKALYFSVGKNAGDLKRSDISTTQTISITNGLAVFNVEQTNDNIGAGNKVTYNSTLSSCYLRKKISPTQWEVSNAFGVIPEDINNSAINHIKHVYNEISDSVDTTGIKTLLGDGSNLFDDLSKSKYQINILVYKDDTFFNDKVVIENFDCDEENYLRIYTPYDLTNECEQSQRHRGWDDPSVSVAKLKILSDLSGEPAVYIKSDNVTVEGLVIDAGVNIGVNNYGVKFLTNSLAKVLDCIVFNAKVGIYNDSANQVIIANNIVYDVTNSGIGTGGTDFVYNNTVFTLSSVVIANSYNDIVINCIAQTYGVAACYSYNSAISYCLSSDATAGSNEGCQNNKTIVFVDKANKNFNLKNDDLDAIGTGKHLETNNDYSFSKDSRGTTRSNRWSLGANEFEVKKLYSAISRYKGSDLSTRNPYNGGLQFKIFNSRIIFEVAQVNSDMGIGFEVIKMSPGFDNGCILKEKINGREWLVTDYSGENIVDTSTSQVSKITPVYESLSEASNEIEGIDLVYDNIQLNLVCYKTYDSYYESVYFLYVVSDKKNYLKIYTPDDITKEVNSSQRHEGVISTGFAIENYNNSSPAIKIQGCDFVEITGLCIKSSNDGIVIQDGNGCYVTKNIIKAGMTNNGDGISIIDSLSNSNEFIINNLVYGCNGNGIKAGSKLATTGLKVRIYNNTVIDCVRGIYFLNPLDGSPVDGLSINNICQDSLFRDYVCDSPNTSFFSLQSCISSDETATIFGGSLNYKNTKINFANRVSESFFLNKIDYPAVNTGDILNENASYYYNEDITSSTRNYTGWSRGAFEDVNINGLGTLEVAPIIISGVCSTLAETPVLELHLRETPVVNNLVREVSEEHQFDSISDLNDFLADNSSYNSYNLIINIQSGLSISGTFVLGTRSPNLTVTVRCYPPELSQNIPVYFYQNHVVEDIVNQSVLTFENIKVFCDNPDTYPLYLISESSATVPLNGSKKIKFINSIIQLNYDAIAFTSDINKNLITVESINSLLIYRNAISSNDLYLIKGRVAEENKILNSIVLTYSDFNTTFKTSNTEANDIVENVLTYNYNNQYTLSINSDNKISCIENTNPLFSTAVIATQLFDTQDLAAEDFNPDLNSPVFDAGNNSHVTDIPLDIIGNSRIFNRRLVDIGAYELQVHMIEFKPEDIRSVYQDKLTLIDSPNYAFKSSNFLLTDLYNDFYDNENYRLDFSRESKIIVLLKSDENQFNVYNDKEMILVNEFEAFYDNENLAIVITKDASLFGNLFNNIFKDSRYSFKFNQIEHKLSVYLVDTYNKGTSGVKNLINNVRFGGSPVLTN